MTTPEIMELARGKKCANGCPRNETWSEHLKRKKREREDLKKLEEQANGCATSENSGYGVFG